MADRFLITEQATIDLATGRTVVLRQLPACEARDEQRWSATCARLAMLWHEDMSSLVDYGVLADSRFEAYDRPDAPLWNHHASEAVIAFLADAGLADSGPRPSNRTGARGPVRLGVRLIAQRGIGLLGDLLEDGRSGSARVVVCSGEPGAGRTTFLQLAAAEGRRRGYAALSVNTLERWPELAASFRDRHVLVLCDSEAPSAAGERWLLRFARWSPAGHVLLRAAGERTGSADVTLVLAAHAPHALVRCLSVYPPAALSEHHVERAAVRSGGLPGPFLTALRPDRGARVALKVAEARAAYRAETPGPARMDHPWTDMIAGAERLLASGRRAAAERELRQIAGAAARRQMGATAAAANVRLAWLLLNRGRLDAAEELLRPIDRDGGLDQALAVDAALALAAVQVERGALDAAESILRAARALDHTRTSLALGRCLIWQARYPEAERCVAALVHAREQPVRAAAEHVLAAAALGQRDYTRAARHAHGALSALSASGDERTAIGAREVLVSVHAAVGDRHTAAAHARAAMQLARRSGRTLDLTRLRASTLEGLNACGQPASRRGLDRLLSLRPHVTPLCQGSLFRVGARLHPSSRERLACERQLTAFVAASGARSLLPDAGERSAMRLADAVNRLLEIQETAPDPRAAIRLFGEWLLRSLELRAVQIGTADGELLATAGASEPIEAAKRVLLTRVTQPPWGANGEPAECAIPLRIGGKVIGSLAARWPVSRVPDDSALSLLTTAAAFVATAVGAVIDRRAVPAAPTESSGIIGRSDRVERLRETVARAGSTPFAILIEGESGSGKELVARAVHAASPRRHRSCVAVNCAALGDDLLEAELFGHTRGAFTGAHVDRPGLFEQADGGTLFLDEVSELSPRAQAKLLRALQDGEVRRVGENLTRRVDVRVVAASNRRLEDDVAPGRFRKDLLFRLAVIRIEVPPLRERREDIPLLAAHYWRVASERAGSRGSLTSSAIEALVRHDWPGNVRELQNVMAALAVQVPRGRVTAEHVGALVAAQSSDQPRTLEEARRRFDREFVATAIARSGGRYARAARELGVSRQGLAKLLKRLSLEKAG